MDNNILNIFLLYTCFLINISASNRGLSELKVGLGNLNKCDRCKVFTNSYNYWLVKTSRGKYEGGDAAWEEAKLRSYSNSEIRLTEVQEGLCTELKKHQDYCYTLAEETETVLEKWWFMEDKNSLDFFTWLCIETLQHCCPQNHYGNSCELCPMDKNSEVCGGHGQCDGDGTREGNGTCLCKQGYDGIKCEACGKKFYNVNSECLPCHKACSECTGNGMNACVACNTGWHMKYGACVDIDECLETSICKDNEHCVNWEGSYKCQICDQSCKTCQGEGSSNCTSCDYNLILWNGLCINEDKKVNILRNTFKRAGLYLGFLIITLFIQRHSRKLASVIVIIVAVYIYFAEKSCKDNIMNVFTNLYINKID
jgi:protein disulfide-isomerase